MSAKAAVLNGVRENFVAFAAKTFNIMNPGTNLAPTPGFLALSQKLADVHAGKVKRLLVNIPPRSAKTLLCSVAFPAYVLGRDPTKRIICVSYSADLAAKNARDCRTVMTHASYRHLFPSTILNGKNTETEMETSRGGFRYSTSVGGTLTGRGGNFIIVDDPMKAEEAFSAPARERVWDWYTGTLSSRLDQKTRDAIIVVMQRLHPEDLSGRLLDQGEWDHLCLPAIATEEQVLDIGYGRACLRKPGDLLDAVRENHDTLAQTRRALTSVNFDAQYQQQPLPENGQIIEWGWFQTYSSAPQRSPGDIIAISWDSALQTGQHNDYSVGIVGLVKVTSHVYILDVIRDRLRFPDLCQRIQAEARRWGAATLIEESVPGIPLIQQLRTTMQPIGVRPLTDKVVRLQEVTPRLQGGQVYLPESAPWLHEFKRELMSFPHGRHDDQVDAFSQLLRWVNTRIVGPLQGRASMTEGVRPGWW